MPIPCPEKSPATSDGTIEGLLEAIRVHLDEIAKLQKNEESKDPLGTVHHVVRILKNLTSILSDVRESLWYSSPFALSHLERDLQELLSTPVRQAFIGVEKDDWCGIFESENFTRPPFEFNNYPSDVISGLRQDTHNYGVGIGICIDVGELCRRYVVGIKVRRESVTQDILHLMNLSCAGLIEPGKEPIEEAAQKLKGKDDALLKAAQNLIAKEKQDRYYSRHVLGIGRVHHGN